MFQLRKTGKKGFTLVEAVAVIAILAILTAIIIPLAGQYIQDSNANSDMAAARSIENAVKVSASEINTKRADSVLIANPDVEHALINLGFQNSILIPKRSNYFFYFNKTTQAVEAFNTAPVGNYEKLQTTTPLSKLGLVP